MMKIKIVLGFLLFVQYLALAEPQSSSTTSSSYGKPITADSKIIYSEDFSKNGDPNAIVAIEKTITLKHNIDSIRLTSFNGVINVIEGGVNHNYCKIETLSYFAGAPLQTRIEIYGNGAMVKSLSMILMVALCVVYYAL
ncbi:uncharacterized protein [Chironomus tepperi]|uniref:uncharacterized protein n=1 Tax=Chironomus tepperi TaxID=113505 RepID=UPI00391F168C